MSCIITKHSKELSIFSCMLSIDLNLLKLLIGVNQKNSQYSLHLNGITYNMVDVTVTHSPTPVTSPTTRGGVYFSDKFAYKIKGSVNNTSIISKLSNTMLGPNTEFGEIKITTQIEDGRKKIGLSLFTNLINSVQEPSKIELNMIIVRLESS